MEIMQIISYTLYAIRHKCILYLYTAINMIKLIMFLDVQKHVSSKKVELHSLFVYRVLKMYSNMLRAMHKNIKSIFSIVLLIFIFNSQNFCASYRMKTIYRKHTLVSKISRISSPLSNIIAGNILSIVLYIF